jgi:hypothetical protein
MEVKMEVAKRGRLVGMILGDGYVNTTNNKSELSVLHSVAQRDYCEHKAALVRMTLGGKFNVREYANGPGGKYKAVKFVSSNPYWANLKSWIYPGGKKTFTRKVLDMLTPEGIAIWYMDDGHARTNTNSEGWVTSVATNIATMCSESECTTIRDYFLEVHQIEWKIRCRKGSAPDRAFFIECNTTQSRKFAELVRPYIISSMLYKLAHVASLDSHECRTPVGACVQCEATIYEHRRTGLCAACYSRRYYREVRRFIEDRKPRQTGDEIVRPNANNEALEVVDKEPPR